MAAATPATPWVPPTNSPQIVEKKLRLEGIKNQAELARKAKVLAKARAAAVAAERTFPPCVTALQRLIQTSVKLVDEEFIFQAVEPKSWKRH